MSNKDEILSLIKTQGVLPLYFHADANVCINILQALYHAGIQAVEFTNRGEQAFENFLQLKSFKETKMPGVKLGIGTIKTKNDARMFMNAGADFLVCPGFVKNVMDIADEAEILCVPGCMTSTEIIRAERSGAQFIKIFPGSLLGPSYITALKDIFRAIDFMPTGGVDATKENIEAWFKAGVAAVGMGNKLFSKQDIESGNFENITQKTKMVLSWINETRSSLLSK